MVWAALDGRGAQALRVLLQPLCLGLHPAWSSLRALLSEPSKGGQQAAGRGMATSPIHLPQPEPIQSGGQKAGGQETGDWGSWSFLREAHSITPSASALDPCCFPGFSSPPQAPYVPNAMDILDGIADLPPEFLLIKLHLRRRARDGGSGPILLPGLGTRASSGVVGET